MNKIRWKKQKIRTIGARCHVSSQQKRPQFPHLHKGNYMGYRRRYGYYSSSDLKEGYKTYIGHLLNRQQKGDKIEPVFLIFLLWCHNHHVQSHVMSKKMQNMVVWSKLQLMGYTLCWPYLAVNLEFSFIKYRHIASHVREGSILSNNII